MPGITRLARRAGERARARGVGGALAILFGIGILLRIAIAVAVSPVELNNVDTLTYVGMAEGELFEDPVRPAGYSMFLRGLHAISDQLALTILVQHLLGIATAALLYATVRRLAAPVWAAAAAAAAVLLSLDQIYLEHTLLAETLFTLLLTATFYCCVRALEAPRAIAGRLDSRLAWIVAAGLLLGLSAWVRTLGLTLFPLLALWVALAIGGGWKQRVARGLVCAAAAGVVILAYFAAHDAARGYFGLTDGAGRVLLGRVSPFADCSKFDPPPRAEPLCVDAPKAERFGSDYFIWDRDSPAWKAFGPLPAEDDLAREFAMRAILAQPLEYAELVLSDTARHFVPGLNDERYGAGTPYDFMKLDRRDPEEPAVLKKVESYYEAGAPQVRTGLAAALSDLQDLLRVHQILMLQAVILSGFGLWFARGSVRAGIALFIGAGVLMLLIPSLTATYNARYAVPLGGAFTAAAMLSIWVLAHRARERPAAGTEPGLDSRGRSEQPPGASR